MEDIYTVHQILETLANSHYPGQSSGAVQFASLMQHKRNPSDDAGTQRRLSASEMQPKAGFFGSMWNR